jgi:hypothetical protein
LLTASDQQPNQLHDVVHAACLQLLLLLAAVIIPTAMLPAK